MAGTARLPTLSTKLILINLASPIIVSPQQRYSLSYYCYPKSAVFEPGQFFEECPVRRTREGYRLDHTAKARRLAGRRREEATEVFRERYRIRSGIEGTNSGLKRRMGLARLRVRGSPRVFASILLKITGWNILRASACAKMREIVYKRAGVAVLADPYTSIVGVFPCLPYQSRSKCDYRPSLDYVVPFNTTAIAA